jgi:hypothetical protein
MLPAAQLERRAVPRIPTSERATAIVDGDAKRACIITDLSPKGARLGFADNTPLPPRFSLVFAGGTRVRCQRIWQRELVAGIQFEIRPTLWERLARLARVSDRRCHNRDDRDGEVENNPSPEVWP